MLGSEVRNIQISSAFVVKKICCGDGSQKLEMTAKYEGNNSRLTCWSLNLKPYQFKVWYRPGKVNSNADRLLRMWDPRLNTDIITVSKGSGVKDRGQLFSDDLGEARGPETVHCELVKSKKHHHFFFFY